MSFVRYLLHTGNALTIVQCPLSGICLPGSSLPVACQKSSACQRSLASLMIRKIEWARSLPTIAVVRMWRPRFNAQLWHLQPALAPPCLHQILHLFMSWRKIAPSIRKNEWSRLKRAMTSDTQVQCSLLYTITFHQTNNDTCWEEFCTQIKSICILYWPEKGILQGTMTKTLAQFSLRFPAWRQGNSSVPFHVN